jgi:cystathionine beta-synthase
VTYLEDKSKISGPRQGEAKIASSLLDLIGNTPLLRLNRIASDLPGQVLLKLESSNPGGSVKDRVALEMIEAAEREGLLKPGGTIVEPTSGNTGVGLAIVAAQRGYNCVFVVTDKVSKEKVDLLRAYGAEVVICPVAVAPEDPNSYYSTAERLTREIPNAFRPDQYSNPNNPLAHEKTTGPEIWEQTEGRITHFVAGMGTGGTITGVARYLKSRNPNVRIIGADPVGSVYSGGSGRPYLTEGVGEDFWPTTFEPSLVDKTIAITDRDAFLLARRVAREEGVLIGGSGAMAIAGAIAIREELTDDSVVVVLIPDSGRGYLSKIFNDEWMTRYGFLDAESPIVAEVIAPKQINAAELWYVNPEDSVRSAIEQMRLHNVSQLLVAKNEPPFAAAEVIGSVNELALMDQAFSDGSILDQPVQAIMEAPLPTIGSGQSLDDAVALLDSNNALLVLSGGIPTAVLSRTDVLTYFAAKKESL